MALASLRGRPVRAGHGLPPDRVPPAHVGGAVVAVLPHAVRARAVRRGPRRGRRDRGRPDAASARRRRCPRARTSRVLGWPPQVAGALARRGDVDRAGDRHHRRGRLVRRPPRRTATWRRSTSPPSGPRAPRSPLPTWWSSTPSAVGPDGVHRRGRLAGRGRGRPPRRRPGVARGRRGPPAAGPGVGLAHVPPRRARRSAGSSRTSWCRSTSSITWSARPVSRSVGEALRPHRLPDRSRAVQARHHLTGGAPWPILGSQSDLRSPIPRAGVPRRSPHRRLRRRVLRAAGPGPSGRGRGGRRPVGPPGCRPPSRRGPRRWVSTPSLDGSRRRWLRGQVVGVMTTCRKLAGEDVSYVDEVESGLRRRLRPASTRRRSPRRIDGSTRRWRVAARWQSGWRPSATPMPSRSICSVWSSTIWPQTSASEPTPCSAFPTVSTSSSNS